MELKDIVNISGKSGLHRIVKPIKTGLIVESLDAQKIKTVASASDKVSVLQEVSIYTHNAEGSTPLATILKNIYLSNPTGIEIDTKKASNEDFYGFMEVNVPDFDKSKVYPSDIKKLITWYNILLNVAPEMLANLGVEEQKNEDATEDTSKEPA